MANRLQFESSPYLLQHANNPVDWYPWGDEALNLAKEKNLPILVSIGYATCHWCHVMERESFEDNEVAAFMNEHFVNIKVDREERPDLDQIYMNACQIINGSGGWPLNCFLLPDGRPFYANTYFPPKSGYRRPSWRQVLENISRNFHEKPEVVQTQAEKLMEIISGDSALGSIKSGGLSSGTDLPREYFDTAFDKMKLRFDRIYGGFGTAPKFPGTHSLTFLLRYGLQFSNEEAISHVRKSIMALVRGGIFDHLGGGFARYTVDQAWVVPHFEKMLYDNGLILGLIGTYLSYFPEEEEMVDAWKKTYTWLYREMLGDQLFYSAIDADSEGEEGRFYVWDYSELTDNISSEDQAKFDLVYNIKAEGNWEGKNILNRISAWEDIARRVELQGPELRDSIEEIGDRLLALREKRIRPITDDKQILAWNGLLLSGILKGAHLLTEEQLNQTRLLFEKVREFFPNKDRTQLHRLVKEGSAKQVGFLEDFAFFINALLDAYEVFWDTELLKEAKHWMEIAWDLFHDSEHPLFFFSQGDQANLIHRAKEFEDGALPSANGVMARSLYRLGLLFDKPEWREKSEHMLEHLKSMIRDHPLSSGLWLDSALHWNHGDVEIAIVGKEAVTWAKSILRYLKLRPVIMVNTERDDSFPLLEGRGVEGSTLIYICKNYACHKPAENVKEAVQLLSHI
ncbi:MAG: thioredoxin domain-containing protein [Saprospiraceae bacterium]|nr:thioredoxin domain-containing protein [Saprospiraceae bacterium]